MLQRTNCMQSTFAGRRPFLVLVSAVFAVSRIVYYWLGVRFDSGPLRNFWQIIDPALLREAPWQSLFYQRTQMPGFNLYLAAIMQLFPRHSDGAFQITYLLMGLVSVIALFLLLDRLLLSGPLCLLIVCIYAISPVTVLYENWLFYEYPLALLFCLAALFLHRYATSQHQLDGIAFFSCLASLALTRVIYHLIWFVIIAALLVYALPRFRRRTVLCAAFPAILIFIVYLKSFILFGIWMPGSDVYGGINFAFITSGAVPQTEIARMAARHQISPILLHGFSFEDDDLLDVAEAPPRTGIPILDERLKSTGRINMDSLWMAQVAMQLRKDGLSMLESHPSAALATIRRNLEWYFLPADVGWPFGGTPHPNQQVLAPFLRRFDLVTAGKVPAHNVALVSWLAMPLLLVFGFWRSVLWARSLIRRTRGSARDMTIAFAFGNIAFLSVIVIFYDFTDQNRILFEMSPLFAVLLGGLIVFVTRKMRGFSPPRRRSPLPSNLVSAESK